MGICKLCTKDKPLIKKSHIYPDFVYSDLYDEHHKLIKFDVAEMKKLDPRISKPASGVYEGNLLCKECDNEKIGKLETYVAGLLNGGDQNVICENGKLPDGLDVIQVKSLNYLKLKNFILSLLFRADISTFDEFKEVHLGPYRDKIRTIIDESISTDDSNFQINIFRLSDDSNFNQLIGQPVKSKVGAETVYSILMKGYLVITSIKSNQTSKKIEEIKLKSDGTVDIPVIPKRIEKKFIFDYFGLH